MTTPMRVTIIPSDYFCSVDGVGFSGVNVTSVPPEVHAVQWHSTHGEEEIIDPATERMLGNRHIANLNSYQDVLNSYWEIRAAYDQEQQEAQEEQVIVEV
jgi:hypothetical protein